MAKKKTIRTIPQQRTPMREQDPRERAKNFAEVACGYRLEDALKEAEGLKTASKSLDKAADAAGIVHCVVGKLSFSEAQLAENIEALLKFINTLKPASSEGVYVRSITVSATMSPGITIAA